MSIITIEALNAAGYNTNLLTIKEVEEISERVNDLVRSGYSHSGAITIVCGEMDVLLMDENEIGRKEYERDESEIEPNIYDQYHNDRETDFYLNHKD